jgi:hypothetical protein
MTTLSSMIRHEIGAAGAEFAAANHVTVIFPLQFLTKVAH